MEWPEMVFLAVVVIIFLLFGGAAALTGADFSNVPGLNKWETIVNKWAKRYGLDPYLLGAVILQESGGVSGIYGYSDQEVGLMQILPDQDGDGVPEAYEDVIEKKGVPPGLNLELPDNNVRVGAAYLSLMIDQAGNIEDGLRYYNAGPTGAKLGRGYGYAESVLSIYRSIKQ